jgi:lysine-N-methylase
MNLSVPLKMIAPSELQRYDCSGCGDCCRGRFAIVITQEDKERIEAQGWADEELGLKGKPLFTPHAEGFHLAHRPDGACVFLQADNKCLIHARHGEPAKPVACRLYPFTFVPTGSQVRIDVRFDCPSTAGNRGRPISQHRQDLQVLVGKAVPNEASAQPVPPLYDDVTLTWEQLGRVTQTFEQVLLDVSLDLTRRVAACVDLAEVLRHPRIGALKGRKLDEFLDDLASQAQESALDDDLERGTPPGPARLTFRQLVGLYGRIDQVGGKANFGRRLAVSLRMLGGRGEVPPIREDFPRVGFADIEAMRGVPSGEAAQSIERYLHVHLTSQGFFGPSFYGRSYLDGLKALLLTYPLIGWYARAFAISEGLTEPDVACVTRALMVVDHQHGISPLLNAPSERTRINLLTERLTLRSLVIWYGS